MIYIANVYTASFIYMYLSYLYIHSCVYAGVILGNYRCNLSGHDLNRAYPEPDATLHPEICTIKKLAK